MKFIVADNYDDMSRIGADLVIKQISIKPESVLGLATGSTPLGLYRGLITANKDGLDFSNVTTFNLDEYYGLSHDHTQSYHYFMEQNLFNHLNVDKAKIHIPDGMCKDIEKECLEYDRKIDAAGGIDLQVLGIGRNGHIGFNEPDDSLEVRTHLTNLTQDTIDANSRFFECTDDVPRMAITMGLGTIMKAKQIILLASGRDKAPVLSKLVRPVIDTDVPASILNLHSNVTIIADREAAMLINTLDTVAV